MTIWALADLHLSISHPAKDMAVFGAVWENYMQKISDHWKDKVSSQDLVLLPGDISWAMKLEEAVVDLAWIDQLPGTKLMIRGNHDYWWSSSKKMAQKMPPSIHFIHNNAFHWKDVAIAGSRLWDSSEYRFDAYVHFQNSQSHMTAAEKVEQTSEEAIFERELIRLKLSLEQMDPQAACRIAMTHYPPIGADLAPSKASALLAQYHVNMCVFGHLHSIQKGLSLFGSADGIQYRLVAADYVDFCPVKIYET